jgi:AcrR family transcriptional regulator
MTPMPNENVLVEQAPAMSPMTAHILEAAESCFERSGLRSASMVEIADAAGVSRQTIYNNFENKRELVTAFLERQAQRAYGAARRKLDVDGPPDSLLVDAELALLRASRSRRYSRILLDPDAFDLTSDAIRSSDLIDSIARGYWMPYLERLAAAGRLRPGLDLDRAVDWLQLMHLLVVTHPELFGNDDQIRRTYTEFVTQALLRA